MHNNLVRSVNHGLQKTLVSIAGLIMASTIFAQQQTPFERLSMAQVDIASPALRVSGEPGNMLIQQRACRAFPADELRRRIVNAATQEWAYFGFNVIDQTAIQASAQNASGNPNRNFVRRRSPYSRFSAAETARVADSIGGYWSATNEGEWILERQNQLWQDAGIRSRWRDAWSAAFISWVMCEGGVSQPEQFERAIAHHTYIDQAIRARDGLANEAMYTAYDPGEMSVSPGDLLCRGSRPRYQSIDQRRQQLGVGARTHCDIVVKVDQNSQQIMAIGGNVRETVSLKVLAADSSDNQHFHPVVTGRRAIFAHLKLKTEQIEANALDQSPTMMALSCTDSAPTFAQNITLAIVSNC